MDAKGSSLITTREFVKKNFGEDGLKRWLEALSPESKKLFASAIISTSWYSLKDGLVDPTRKICGMFYNGDLRGAWEAGRHSAEHGLNGIYKFFIQIASPQFIIKKASTILPTYYRPSVMKASEVGPNGAIVEILEFKEISDVIESRVAGWMEKALEICGCKNINVAFIKSMAHGQGRTQYVIKWEK
jgi:hypothetical protein